LGSATIVISLNCAAEYSPQTLFNDGRSYAAQSPGAVRSFPYCTVNSIPAIKLRIIAPCRGKREPAAMVTRYQAKLKNQPSRSLLVDRLKTFEKALCGLQDECRRSTDLMHDFLPHDTLGYIGQSLTFSAMSEAGGTAMLDGPA
jgi:hypothetical protein